jgi:hypothetical protein
MLREQSRARNRVADFRCKKISLAFFRSQMCRNQFASALGRARPPGQSRSTTEHHQCQNGYVNFNARV